MRFGSVCSGIEAASVAWEPLGWQAAWLAEIEPFPAAVLKYHYANVPNLGDMTRLPEMIRAGEVEAPDLFCGGTPCQAFSVAGLRKSLDDARGNLSITFCEIANAIDHVRHVRGEPPSIVVWENVPGVLSTKDNAFGCFLAGLAGEDVPLEPPGGKWTDAGVVLGPARTVAWRILDAQYFGLAQRRRRVFVVASAREGFDPAAVLFEFEGVRRDSAPSREAGKGTARGAASGAAFGGNRTSGPIDVAPALNACDARQSDVIQYGDKTGPLDTDGHSVGVLAFDTTQVTSASNYSSPKPGDPCHPLAAGAHAPAVAMRESGQGYWMQDDIAGTIDANMGMSGHANRPAVINQPPMQVRRLTPVECERLQGFPDGYTAIPWRNKPASECPDGPRYKALGNSWAVPVVHWIGRRIHNALVKGAA
jgi:DNA (cytosine-5)-methyltransferase 1